MRGMCSVQSNHKGSCKINCFAFTGLPSNSLVEQVDAR